MVKPSCNTLRANLSLARGAYIAVARSPAGSVFPLSGHTSPISALIAELFGVEQYTPMNLNTLHEFNVIGQLKVAGALTVAMGSSWSGKVWKVSILNY